MLVNLTDVFTSSDSEISMDVPIEMGSFRCRCGEYPILQKTPVHYVFRHCGKNRASVSGKARVTLEMQCDRCLKRVPWEVSLDFGREVSPEPEEGREISEEDDFGLMEGYSLNTEALIYNEILLNQPEKVLCRPDCRGICMKCGKDLNDGECGCDTFVPDPRMAAIQDIFNAYKEV